MRKKETGFLDSASVPIRTGDYLARNYWSKDEPKWEVFNISSFYMDSKRVLTCVYAHGDLSDYGDYGNDGIFDERLHEAFTKHEECYVIPRHKRWKDGNNWKDLTKLLKEKRK